MFRVLYKNESLKPAPIISAFRKRSLISLSRFYRAQD